MTTKSKTAAKAAPAKAPAKKTPAPEATETKGPGVIASILEYLTAATAAKPLSKADLLAKLAKRFPDRTTESMAKTINCQVPGRMAKEKGVKIHKNDEGFWIK